jgi:hypothetical protein
VASTDFLARLGESSARVGFELASIGPALIERLATLDACSPVLADAERISAWAFTLFRHYELSKPDQAFDAEERRVVILASLFSDIGKTGPLRADAAQRTQIAQMFAVEGVKNDAQTVKSFVRSYFSANAEERLWALEKLGIDPEMSIRTFWNLHSQWTLEILQAGGLPFEVMAAAAAHHLLEDVNPKDIVGTDLRFNHSSGANAAFDRAEKLVIVLDKYDAARRRGQLTHSEAIAWVRARLQTHPEFREDSEFRVLIADLEAVAS